MTHDTKHTPGPWANEGRKHMRSGSRWEYVISDAAGLILAEVEQPEDARLIAAAPDMAEALQAICDNNSAPHPIMDMARAALAKARGETH